MKTDIGPFAFAGVMIAIAAFVVVPASCSQLPSIDTGYSDRHCTLARQSIEGSVVQTCYAESTEGFAMCRYRLVHVPLGCECREWRVRLTCKGQWEKVKRVCECEDIEEQL